MIVHQSTNGPIRVVLEAHGPWTNMLKQRERDRVIRDALNMGARRWIGQFLGPRFSDYSRRALGYNGPTEYTDGQKRFMAEASGQLQAFRDRNFGGWNPYSGDRISTLPGSPFSRWLAHNGGTESLRGKRGVERASFVREKKAAYRRWAKALTKNFIAREVKVAKKEPFVMSGTMREKALQGAKPVSATKGGINEVRIAVPYGHAVRTEYSEQFRSVPPHEVAAVAETIGEAMADQLNGLTSRMPKRKAMPRSTRRLPQRLPSRKV